MKKVTTKLTDEQLLAIAKSGETPYSFLQKAAQEKLLNDQVGKNLTMIAMAMSERLGKLESALLEKMGDYKTVNAEVLDKNTSYLKKLSEQIMELKKQ